MSETSLRMQRKLADALDVLTVVGNISAHAEKTMWVVKKKSESEKHLCACRENHLRLTFMGSEKETSLRMQRKLTQYRYIKGSSRNISAHAEKTPSSKHDKEEYQKHLCACRENSNN